jgi:hypothetical protein
MIIKNVGRGIWTMTDLDKLALEAAARAAMNAWEAVASTSLQNALDGSILYK